MKLSQIKGDRCFEVIADIIEPISIIASDKTVVEMLKPKKTPEGMQPKEFFIKRMKDGLPVLLRDHKTEFVAIMAALNGVDKKDYLKNLNLANLFSDVVDMLNDEELLAFLS